MTTTMNPSMRSLGLIGGTTWRSTVEYYSLINAAVNAHFGDNTNPPLVVSNVNHAAVQRLQRAGDWAGIADTFVSAGRGFKASGVEMGLLCANTTHQVYDEIVDGLELPFLHIGDALGEAIRSLGIRTVGFIGTRFSTEGDFVTDRIEALARIIHEPATTSG